MGAFPSKLIAVTSSASTVNYAASLCVLASMFFFLWALRSGWRGSLRLACGCTRRPEMSPLALDRPVLIPQILSRGFPAAVLLRS